MIRKIKLYILKVLEFLRPYREFSQEIYHEKVYPIAKFLFMISGFLSIGTLTLEFGFYFPTQWNHTIQNLNLFVINYFLLYELVSLILTRLTYKEFILTHKPELIIVTLIVLQKFFEKRIFSYFQNMNIDTDQSALYFLAISQIFLVFSQLISFLRKKRIYTSKRLNPSFMFFISFAAIILLGTVLLALPRAHKVDIPLIDIVFTVISATCVTGLSTIDIGSSYTFTGHVILMILIQVGGLGLITLTSFFAIFLAGQASVNDRLMMKDLLSEEALGRVRILIGQITLQTFVIEAVGSVLLFLSFPKNTMLEANEKIFYSIFHSVSAFCNAGFSLFPGGLGESFMVNQKSFLSVIMILILLGGIGFNVISQFQSYIPHIFEKKLRISVSNKLSLLTSFSLLIFGFLAYYFLEQKYTLNGLSNTDGLFHSLFYSVTARTAGFNTLDVGKMGNPMIFFSLLLMWVGASPNSTGGGIKTTTFAVAFLQIIEFVRGKTKLEIFHRTIAESSVYRASATIVLSLFVIFISIFSLLLAENFTFLDICYEVVSAYGTAGLSRGITGSLCFSSKFTLCITMFMGRVGVLTTLIALIPKKTVTGISYPDEFVIVG